MVPGGAACAKRRDPVGDDRLQKRSRWVGLLPSFVEYRAACPIGAVGVGNHRITLKRRPPGAEINKRYP